MDAEIKKCLWRSPDGRWAICPTDRVFPDELDIYDFEGVYEIVTDDIHRSFDSYRFPDTYVILRDGKLSATDATSEEDEEEFLGGIPDYVQDQAVIWLKRLNGLETESGKKTAKGARE